MALEIINGLILAWLWRQGGKTDTVWRRIVAPVFILLITLNFYCAGIFALVSRLPVTLIGDDLKKHWQLLWWVPLFCIFHAIPLFIASDLAKSAILCAVQISMIVGSNKFNFPAWNWYEKTYGFILGCLL